MQVTCIAVSHPNHYTEVFLYLCETVNGSKFMHKLFFPIHLIGQKIPLFRKKLECVIYDEKVSGVVFFFFFSEQLLR